jgi:hypothetical protein
VEYPIREAELLDLALCDEAVNYFHFTEALTSLKSTGHVEENENGEISITQKGRANGSICEDEVAYSVRLKCDRSVAEMNRALQRRNQVRTEILSRKDGNGVTVTGYLGAGGEVTVPATLGGLPVSAIGDRAFADRSDVTAVVLPVGISRVGWFAFSGCVSLARISLPGSITAISYGAFENCPQTLTVLCPAGSYAEQYAISYGLRVVN